MEVATDKAAEEVSYRDHPAIAQSDLKMFYANPMAFYLHKICGEKKPQKTTAAMTFGTLIDAFVCSPELIVPIPQRVLASNGARRGKAWDAFKAEHEGMVLVTEEDVATFQAIQDYAKTYHSKVYNALFVHEKKTHLRYVWKCPHTALDRKCELDIWLPEYKMAIDLKTTADPSYDAFVDSCWRFGYHIQAATYIEALQAYEEEPESYCIVAIRNEWPYDCEIYEIAAEALVEADNWNRRWIMKLADCIDRKDWGPATAETGAQLTRPASFAGRVWDRE